ncbi:MAG TPA: FG-GAP-like repeat-containing protein, partial [Cyclobacteriaceae bacterium]|nr:FG-GAP-like repeat-containing protein [Cyclobacteriaceae bacterium]
MRNLTPFFFLIAVIEGLAQAPVINNVQPLTTGPSQKIVITGSGFSATPASNTVWFDHVKGTVTAATAYSLEVQVPIQARFSNVEVIVNNLSVKSNMKFFPSYGGVSLPDPASPTTPVSQFTPVGGIPGTSPSPFIDTNEQFDIASADFDLDGDPDFVTSRGGPTSGAAITDLTVYQNTTAAIGSVSFSKITVPLTLGGPTANVACGDLNGDGKPDILASRGSNGNTRNEVFVLKNTSTASITFTSQAKLVLDAGEAAFRMAIRDLNGDGKPDVVVSNAHDDQIATTDVVIYVFPNQSTVSTISFGAPMKLTVTGAALTYGLEVQDFDGDGRPDIVVNQFQKSDVFFFRNISTGNISFAPSLKIATTGSFIQLVSADLNNDGLQDLVGTSIGATDNILQVWINKSTPGNIAFDVGQTMSTDAGPWGIDIGDIDGDGDLDIAVATISSNFINLFRQDGPLSFTKLLISTPNYNSRNLR